VSIIIIGIGEDWPKQQHKLKVKGMLGDHGQLLMYDDFDELLVSGFDELLAAACRKLVLHFFVFFSIVRAISISGYQFIALRFVEMKQKQRKFFSRELEFLSKSALFQLTRPFAK